MPYLDTVCRAELRFMFTGENRNPDLIPCHSEKLLLDLTLNHYILFFSVFTVSDK